MVLPALTEATSPLFRPIKYSLFPPLGLATLAAYTDPDDEVTINDEHVEKLNIEDQPDLVVIQVYITSAFRAYRVADHYRAKGCYVVLGGLHVTSRSEEASQHADTIFLGPGEDTWPEFLRDFRDRRPKKRYQSERRTLLGAPPIRRDLINGTCIWSRTRSWFPADVLTSAISATRRRFSAAGNRFIHRPSMPRSTKSNVCRGSICTFSTIIFSGMCVLPPRCSTA